MPLMCNVPSSAADLLRHSTEHIKKVEVNQTWFSYRECFDTDSVDQCRILAQAIDRWQIRFIESLTNRTYSN